MSPSPLDSPALRASCAQRPARPHPVYWIALLIAVPIVLTSAAVPIWAAWADGRATSVAHALVVAGLDEVHLVIVLIALVSMCFKFLGPVSATLCWAQHRSAALFHIAFWLVALAGDTGVVLVSQPVFAEPLPSSKVLLFLLAGWIAIDIIGSLLPVALLRPQAWVRWRPVVETLPAGPKVDVVSPPTQPAPSERPPASARRDIKGELMAFLIAVRQLSPPEAVRIGVRRDGDGSLITSQGRLAARLGVSKGTINRLLRTLAEDGQISLSASASETCIRLLEQHAFRENVSSRSLETL